jgi:antitoxin VapB
MALNIKNSDVERILEEVVALTGESKTEAVRRALEERRQRLALRATGNNDRERFFAFLQDEVWSQMPADVLGTTITKAEEEEILGYGEIGV